MQPDPPLAEALAALECETGLRLRLVGRFERGDEGAWLVEDARDRRCVLKWRPWAPAAAGASERARERTARLRARGVPIPEVLHAARAAEGFVELHALAAGGPIAELTPALAEQAMRLVAAQRDVGLGESGFAARLAAGARSGAEHALRTSARPATRALADRVLALVERAGGVARESDVVHFDFGPANLLADDDRITAVLDWGDCGDGDASYDLVSLAWDLAAWPKAAQGVVARVVAEIEASTSRKAAAAYAAHVVASNLRWASGGEWEAHVVGIGDGFLDRWAAGDASR